MKTLYFEGAGMDFYEDEAKHSDVGNFRIRTSFRNLDGKQIYIELGRTNRWGLKSSRSKKETIISEWALRIDYLHEVTNDPEIDDCNKSRIDYDWKAVRELEYSKADITRWINENLNCDFDAIEVLDMFYGYRVHAGNGTYNLMEDIELNHARAEARRQAYEQADKKYREVLGSKYSTVGLNNMDADSITVRVFAYEHLIEQGVVPRYEKIEVKYEGVPA